MILKMNFLFPILIVAYLNFSPSFTDIGIAAINHQDIYNTADYKLLVAIPKQNIYLYALDWKEEEVKHRGVYKEMLLDLKGKQRYFSCWTVDTSLAFKPELILNDLNKDEKQDLIVITAKWRGTGVFIQEVHVFDVGTFNDIYVMNPIEAIYQNVKTEMTNKNGIININIKIKDKVFNIKAKESDVGVWYDDVAFGSNIEYQVLNNKLIAKVGAQVAFGLNCGDVIMEYDFRNKRLEVTSISFEGFKNQNIFTYSN